MSVKTAIIEHYQSHKEAYLVGAFFAFGAVCFGAGALSGPKVIQVIYKSPGAIQTVDLVRRMHPGYRVLCKETGEQWASIRRAASIHEVSVAHFMKHLRGELPDIGGLHFENLGEM